MKQLSLAYIRDVSYKRVLAGDNFFTAAADSYPNCFPAEFRLNIFFRRWRPNSAATGPYTMDRPL